MKNGTFSSRPIAGIVYNECDNSLIYVSASGESVEYIYDDKGNLIKCIEPELISDSRPRVFGII